MTHIYTLGILYRILPDGNLEVAPTDTTAIDKRYEGAISIALWDDAENREIIGVGDSAFYNSTALTLVILPSTLQYVKSFAFANCSSLTTIVCKSETPPAIDATAFNGCATDKITLYVATASVGAYEKNEIWNLLNVKAYQ